jgi:hypothetical protein
MRHSRNLLSYQILRDINRPKLLLSAVSLGNWDMNHSVTNGCLHKDEDISQGGDANDASQVSHQDIQLIKFSCI